MPTESPGTPEGANFYPKEENLGRNCQYWGTLNIVGCDFPKMELRGRTSCEGIVDDVCLYVKDGREPISLNDAQQMEIKTRMPSLTKNNLPPGETM